MITGTQLAKIVLAALTDDQLLRLVELWDDGDDSFHETLLRRALERFPEKFRNPSPIGKPICPDCGEPQFECPSGMVCKNGHGY